MKRQLKFLFCFSIVLALILASAPLSVFAAPTLPHSFYGTVKIGGADAPVDTVITAKVGTTAYGTYTTTVAGTYGNPPSDYLVVQGPASGDTIDFFVGSQQATETATFQPGGLTQLNLTIASPLTVTINQAAGQADPTSASPINFTVVFNATVTDFATGDVQLSGTAGANTATVTGSGATYNVAVSGMTGSGTVIANILAGRAHDALSNPNNASTSTDNQVTYNVPVGPTVTINQAAGQADPTSSSPINFTVVFSESVADFATGDVTLTGTAGATTATVTGSGTTYNVAVTGMTSSGTVIATIAAGVAHDALSNPNNASTSTDNTVTYNVAPPAAQRLIGADNTGTQGGGGPVGHLTRYQALASGRVTQAKVHSSASAQVKVAAYADNAGEPGGRLAYNDTAQNVVAGWNTLSIPGFDVVSGTYYWLAVALSADGAMDVYFGAESKRYKTITFSTWTWPSSLTGLSSSSVDGCVAGWGTIVPPTPPPTPIPLPPTKPVTFSWTASAGATKYKLQVNTSPGFGGETSLFDSEVTATTQVVAVPIGTTCYWRVRAGNAADLWSDWSPTGTVLP